MRHWRIGDNPIGIGLARAVVLFAVILVPFHNSYSMLFLKMGRRSQVAHKLDEMPGKQLVIVRYSAGHNGHAEWVYNGANIDQSKIVWAREIPGESTAPLLEYFRDRHVWLIEPDVSTALLPYAKTEQQAAD